MLGKFEVLFIFLWITKVLMRLFDNNHILFMKNFWKSPIFLYNNICIKIVSFSKIFQYVNHTNSETPVQISNDSRTWLTETKEKYVIWLPFIRRDKYLEEKNRPPYDRQMMDSPGSHKSEPEYRIRVIIIIIRYLAYRRTFTRNFSDVLFIINVVKVKHILCKILE